MLGAARPVARDGNGRLRDMLDAGDAGLRAGNC